jgi:hypothetical protein
VCFQPFADVKFVFPAKKQCAILFSKGLFFSGKCETYFF